MRKRTLLAAAALITSLFTSLSAQELEQKLSSINAISKVEKLESQEFKEKYLVRFVQPVDPKDASKGTFEQRVIVCHAGFDRPTVIVTEGYGADYALYPRYTEELARMYNTNVVTVEYRYFGQSVPQPRDWQYLTVVNSLNDLHNIVTAMKGIYGGKWISTGISKGGQTTMFYRSYYPDDVDISVPYVAPLNKSLEDGRHEPFLSRQVGTAEERARIKEFMTTLLQRRATLVPMFKEYCDGKKYTFRVPIDEIYDLNVMEYAFAYWQWGYPVDRIPASTADDETLFKHFIAVCEPDYFSTVSPYYAFNVMAAKEIGYYGYDLRPFRKYTSIKNAEDYMHRVMLEPSEAGLKFDKELYRHVVRYLKKNDPKMIYIYGGIDPWGSSGVNTWLNTSKKENLKVYVYPRGSHTTRINTFQDPEKAEISSTITRWLEE